MVVPIATFDLVVPIAAARCRSLAAVDHVVASTAVDVVIPVAAESLSLRLLSDLVIASTGVRRVSVSLPTMVVSIGRWFCSWRATSPSSQHLTTFDLDVFHVVEVDLEAHLLVGQRSVAVATDIIC